MTSEKETFRIIFIFLLLFMIFIIATFLIKTGNSIIIAIVLLSLVTLLICLELLNLNLVKLK